MKDNMIPRVALYIFEKLINNLYFFLLINFVKKAILLIKKRLYIKHY